MRQFLCCSENVTNWTEMMKVFISYSDKQEDCVEILVKTMEGLKEDREGEENKISWNEANNKYLQGKKYKTLFHERNFIAGIEILINIQKCVEECDKMFILLTPDFMKSEWCRVEVSAAQSQDKAVFVRLSLDNKQEDELTELLGMPKNRPIKENLKWFICLMVDTLATQVSLKVSLTQQSIYFKILLKYLKTTRKNVI